MSWESEFSNSNAFLFSYERHEERDQASSHGFLVQLEQKLRRRDRRILFFCNARCAHIIFVSVLTMTHGNILPI